MAQAEAQEADRDAVVVKAEVKNAFSLAEWVFGSGKNGHFYALYGILLFVVVVTAGVAIWGGTPEIRADAWTYFKYIGTGIMGFLVGRATK